LCKKQGIFIQATKLTISQCNWMPVNRSFLQDVAMKKGGHPGGIQWYNYKEDVFSLYNCTMLPIVQKVQTRPAERRSDGNATPQ